MAVTDRRTRARAAIQQVASEHDIPTQLTILSERWNTVAKLGDSGVIAKASTLGSLARKDSVSAFRMEYDVCGMLSSAGALVQHPVSYINVIEIEGLAISFWHEVDGMMGEASESAMVTSLAAIHQLGVDIQLDTPWFATITVGIPESLELAAERDWVEPGTVNILTAYLERLVTRILDFDLSSGFVHGDAQRKNAMAVGDEAIWIDLEDCCIGPHAWDLACLTMNPSYDTNRVLRQYAGLMGTSEIPIDAIDTLKHVRDLQAVSWMLAIQEERDQTFRENTSALLGEILAATTAD